MKNLLLATLLAPVLTISAQGQWQLVQQHPTTFYGVYGLDAQNVWLTSGNGDYFRSTDGGAQLQAFDIPDSYSFLHDIAVLNDNTVLIGGGCYFPFDQCPGNLILHIDADGANWQISLLDTMPFTIGVVDHFDLHPDGQVYAVSDYGGIYHSPDEGVNWAPLPALPPYSINVYSSVQFTDDQTGFVLGNKYIQPSNYAFRLFKTNDGGQTWAMNLEFPSQNINHQRVFQFVDASTGFVPGDAGILYKTIDGGQNWAEQQVGAAAEDLLRVYFADQQTGYLFSYSNTFQSKIYRTTDGGQNWTLDLQVDSSLFYDAHFYDPNSGFAVTSDGKVFARTASNATHEGGGYQQKVVTFPNPADKAFQVNFDIAANQSVHFVLYDVRGRAVLEQALTQNTETIRCGDLPAGAYFYMLTDGEKNCVGKGKVILK